MSKDPQGQSSPINKTTPKHRPGLTIMPDFGGAYLWTNRHVHWSECTDDMSSVALKLESRISKRLLADLVRWQDTYESDFNNLVRGGPFDWVKFHNQGVLLAVRLKEEVGEGAQVFYEKTADDPNCKLNEVREVLLDGQLVPIDQ